MAVKEITTNLRQEIALAPQTLTTGTDVGNIIDVQDADSGVMFTIFTGAYTNGTFTPTLFESDAADMAGATAVADLELVGQDPTSSDTPEVQAVISAANKIKKLGYTGVKRYLRLTIVTTAAAAGAVIGSTVTKSMETKPVEVVA